MALALPHGPFTQVPVVRRLVTTPAAGMAEARPTIDEPETSVSAQARAPADEGRRYSGTEWREPPDDGRDDDGRDDDGRDDELASDVGDTSRLVAGLGGDEPSRALFALVYRQMRSLCAGRQHDVDDLTQMAIEQVLRSLPQFEGRSRLSTWTYRVCYLTLLKHERWYRRWLRRFSPTSTGELPESANEDGRAEDSLVDHERSHRLRAAIETLSPKRRTVVMLHDLEGMRVQQIAEIVGAGVLTVRSRLRDGRKDLAALLVHDPYFGDEACQSQEGAEYDDDLTKQPELAEQEVVP